MGVGMTDSDVCANGFRSSLAALGAEVGEWRLVTVWARFRG
jgi:hypothetical protein